MLRDGKDLGEIRDLLTTNQPCFFEEIDHFHFLSKTVVSDLKAGASLGRKQHIRIWSAACSAGEEPYSIAISLLEALRGPSDAESPIFQPHGWHIEVVASDADTAVLATAADGIYRERSLAEVSLAVRKRYFLRGRESMAGCVRVRKGLADLVHFQDFSLTDHHWPLEGRFDVVFFRNALLHFEQETQELLLRRMLQHLQPHGYLILGQSERLPGLRDAVLPIGNGIYQLRPHGMAKYTGNERRTYPRSVARPQE